MVVHTILKNIQIAHLARLRKHLRIMMARFIARGLDMLNYLVHRLVMPHMLLTCGRVLVLLVIKYLMPIVKERP